MEQVCSAADVPQGTMRGFTVKGRKILLANVGGTYHAMDGVCSHMQGDLAKGKLEGTIVTCPVHGSKFDVTNGKVTGNVSWTVKTFTRKIASDLAVFKTEVKDGAVFVDV
jgi:3-phenylpropionate/trans-cinnamate dioxygenase ferredoxin component